MAAQVFSQLVTIAIQIGTIPLLLYYWGVDRLGVWLVLTAIPAYLAFSDFGFTFVAKNDMAMRVVRGDRQGALATFQSIFVFLSIVCVILLLVGTISTIYVPIGDMINIGSESIYNCKKVIFFQLISIISYQFFLLLCAGIRSEGRAATETMLAAASRLFEAMAYMAAAWHGGGMVEAAASGMVVRLLVMVGTAIWLQQMSSWLKFGVSLATIERLRLLSLPSLGYMLVPLSNATLIQGPLLALGAFATPSDVAVFSVSRTIARLGTSGANMLNYAFTPEYSFSFGSKNFEKFLNYLKAHLFAIAIGVSTYAAVMIIFGKYFIYYISHGKIEPVHLLTLTLSASVALEMIWTAMFAPVSAINRHQNTAYFLAVCATLSAILLWSLPTSVISVTVTVAVTQLLMVFYVSFQLHRLLRFTQQ